MVESGNGGVALLVGAGDAIGAAVARRFAAGGYAVCVARRDAEKSRSFVQEIIASGGVARAVGTDVRSEEAVQALFAQVEAELGPVEVCLFNAGANVKSPLIETGAKLFFRVWELACYGGFLTGREAARHMVPRGRRRDAGSAAGRPDPDRFRCRGLLGFAQPVARRLDARTRPPPLQRAVVTMTDITPRRLVLWGVGTSRTVRAHWALHELDLDYECRAILPRTGETQTAEYTELNPRQKIPLLQDGDFKIAESPAIAAYLSNTYGTRKNALIPSEPREYA